MYISSKISASIDIRFLTIRKAETLSLRDYAILLIQKGAVTIKDDEQEYALSADDIILLWPGRSYTLTCLSQNQILCFVCDKTFLDTRTPAHCRLRVNSAEGKKEDYLTLKKMLEQLALAAADGEPSYTFLSLIYRLLDILFREHTVRDDVTDSNDVPEQIQERVRQVQLYVEEHYHLPVYLQSLADEMFLSPQYLSKFIRQHMGITFSRYVNDVRLHHAMDELADTDRSITEIAFDNGFSNTSAFNKLFKEICGTSPGLWRQEHRERGFDLSSLPEPEQKQEISQSQDSVTEVEISFTEGKEYYPSWRDTINIDDLTVALSDTFHDALSEAQKNLHFRYVRFHNIFSEDIIRPLDTPGEYDFFNLDMIFDFFMEIDIIPFIELSFKPTKMSLISQNMSTQEALFADELSPEEKIPVLQAMLRHFITRYGEQNVSRWRFEIWMKHDEQLHYLESPAKYCEKFKAMKSAVKSLVPRCSVGGCGFNTSADISLFGSLAEEMAAEKIMPDFFSLYMYCYDPERQRLEVSRVSSRERIIPSPDPDYCIHSFQRFGAVIRKYFPEDIPIYVTEFNSGLNGLNHVASSAYQAAFIVKNTLDLFRETECIAYWHLFDTDSRITGDSHVYATGMGLLEHHGIPKAAYFSYELLGRLKSLLADSGRQYIAATNGRNKYQFMACHYVHYSNNYCLSYHTRLDVGHTYDIFEESDDLHIHLDMKDIPKGRYKCVKYILSRDYGSILDKFIHILDYGKISPQELNFMLLNMQAEEVSYYRKAAIPRTEISYIDNPSDSLAFDLTLEPHSVILLSLERQY